MPHTPYLQTKYTLARYELITSCDSSELQLYLYLKLYAINKHDAFPSFTTIQKHLGWSRDKVNGTLTRMRASGRMVVRRMRRGGNVYDIAWYDSVNEPSSDPQPVRKPDQMVRESDRSQSETQTSASPETRLERIGNRTIRKGTITPLPPKGGCGRKVLFYENERCIWLGEILRIQTREGWLNWGGVAPEHFAPFRYGDLTGMEAYRASRKDAGLG